MKKWSSVCLFMALSMAVFAQPKNVAKWNVSSLIFGTMDFGFERVTLDKQSVALNVGWVPNSSIPNLWFDPGNGVSYTAEFKGFKVVPEYRFYKSKGAPKGFYFAPYLRYANYDVTLGADYTLEGGKTVRANTVGTFNEFGLGGAMGLHIIILNKVSVDWTIFGVGVSKYDIEGSLQSNEALLENEYGMIEEELKGHLESIPVVGQHITTSHNDSQVAANLSQFLLNTRTGLSIGIAF